MATYTEITDAEIDQDSPLTQTLMTKYRDNTIAINEFGDGAILSPGAWHPYDMENVGDGADGTIYDFAADGPVLEIVSPDFADGFEYMFLVDLSCDIAVSGASGVTAGISLDLYRQTDAAYSEVLYFSDSGTTAARLDFLIGQVSVNIPRVTKKVHTATASVQVFRLTAADSFDHLTGGVYDSTNQKILRARFRRNSSGGGISGDIDGGTVKMFRRRIAVE